MDFDPSSDHSRTESRLPLLLLAMLLIVPIFGGLGVLSMAIASAFMGL